MVQGTHHYIEMRLNEYLNICCVPGFEFAALEVAGYVSLFHPMVSRTDSASRQGGVEPASQQSPCLIFLMVEVTSTASS